MNKKLFALVAAAASVMSASVAWAQEDQDFRVVNRTGQAIAFLYVAPSGDTNWGDDLLPQDIVEHGESAEITFDPEDDRCLWDINITYEDGTEDDFRQVNLCRVSTVTLTADEAIAS